MGLESPYEKRHHNRSSYEERGVFSSPQGASHMLRIRDICDNGLGAYSRVALPRGENGTISVKLPSDGLPRRYNTEIRWCASCNEPALQFYPFRVGLLIKEAHGEAKQRTTAISSKQAEPAPPQPAAEQPSNYRVKGSMLIDFAKMIKRNHDKPWNKYLTLDDMNLVSEMIIPVAWYPMDAYRRIALAVFQVFGKGQEQSAVDWGRNMVDRVPPDLYKQFFDQGDAGAAIRNYIKINMRVFDFMRMKYKDLSETRAEIAASGDSQVKQAFPELDLIARIVAGAAQRLAEKNGAQSLKFEINKQCPEGEIFSLGLDWS